MAVSGVSGTSAALQSSGARPRSGSLDAAKASIEAKIFDISTCTTTPPALKATMLSNLNARKATIEAQMKQLDKKSDDPAPKPKVSDGSTIHVIA